MAERNNKKSTKLVKNQPQRGLIGPFFFEKIKQKNCQLYPWWEGQTIAADWVSVINQSATKSNIGRSLAKSNSRQKSKLCRPLGQMTKMGTFLSSFFLHSHDFYKLPIVDTMICFFNKCREKGGIFCQKIARWAGLNRRVNRAAKRSRSDMIRRIRHHNHASINPFWLQAR